MKTKIKLDKNVMLVLPIGILVILLGITIVANITAFKNQKTALTDYFYILSETCSQKAQNKVQELSLETEYAGELISRSMLQIDAMNQGFATVMQNSEAEQGLVSTASTLIYGNSSVYEKFKDTITEALSSGASTLSDVVLCDDGFYRFAVATPVTMSYGSHVAVILVYPQSVLDDILSVAMLPEKVNIYLLRSNGTFLTGGSTENCWSDKTGVCSPNLIYNAARGLADFKEVNSGKKFYGYCRSLGVKDWSTYFAMPSSVVGEKVAQNTGIFSRITLVAILLLLGLFIYYYFGMTVTRRKEELDRRKFDIASRQSSRAVFEYDRIKDRFYFINQCEKIKIPGEADFLTCAMGLSYVYPQDRQVLSDAVKELKFNPSVSVTIRASYFGGDSSYRWYYFTATRLAQKGIGSAVLLGIMEDIDEREKERIALLTKATTDSLTGLYNREETERLVNERQRLAGADKEKSSAFVIFDLDDFKGINDSYGHDMGDRALRFFAEKLKSTFRTQDVVGRIGGDEFVVYVTYMADDDFVQKRFANFAESMGKRRAEDEDLPYISCSAGYVTAKEGDVFESLYVRADKALYRAKTIGKNCAVCGDN